jgi:hypothetical protein
MKYILILILGLIHPKFGFAVSGSQLQGGVSLNGVMKSLVLSSNKYPVGIITSSYGYEALNFKNQTNNAAIYCQGGMQFALNTSLLGFSFGGDTAFIHTFGKCEKPSDYSGGFLNFNMSYDLDPSKIRSTSVNFTLSLGFDLKNFNDQLYYYYVDHNEYTGMKIQERVRNFSSHLMYYFAANKLNKKYSKTLKLLGNFMVMFAGLSPISFFELNSEDSENIKADKNFSTSFKQSIADLIYDMNRDMDFYKCRIKGEIDYSEKCMQAYIDAIYFMERIYDSLGGCHAYSYGASVKTEFDIKNYIKGNAGKALNAIKVSLGIGYSHYVLEKNYQTSTSMSALAQKYFWGHNFNKRTGACLKASDTAASELGRYLALMSHKD